MESNRSLRLAVVAKLGDDKLRSKLLPLAALPEVTAITLVRRDPLGMPGVRDACPPPALRPLPAAAEAWRLLTLLRLCAGRERPTHVLGFYFVPHVAYVEIARRAFGVATIPVAISQEDVERVEAGGFFRTAALRAHAVGVRGDVSARRLVAAGVPAARVFAPPNVFQPGPFRPDPRVVKDLDLVFVGDLEPVKQVGLLLEATARLRALGTPARLALLGDGPERPRLASLAAELGLGEAVVFAGRQDPASIARFMQRARVFVMASRHEGLPMAMIEALCCGLPVVAPDVGDVTSVARHAENAWIVQDRSPDGFAHAFRRVLGEAGLREHLAEGALRWREGALPGYSLEAATAAWRAALSLPRG